MKRYKDAEQGFPPEDELSTQIKYKAGYFAFIASMYIWLSAIIAMVLKSYLTRNYHENED